MKKILIGLLALISVSAFANCDVNVDGIILGDNIDKYGVNQTTMYSEKIERYGFNPVIDHDAKLFLSIEEHIKPAGLRGRAIRATSFLVLRASDGKELARAKAGSCKYNSSFERLNLGSVSGCEYMYHDLVNRGIKGIFKQDHVTTQLCSL
ncbi:MAG: hypothetical protein N4A33_13520 [Bacteriovoracaceae bacterium]|jgi:hypothetical protein|nr:hypothetical protein [Bacteriovoracaceae bacterium]